MAKVAVGFSESFDTVEAAAEAADRAKAGLEGSCDLCVVFASGPHLSMAKWLLSEVHDRLEPAHLIGCGAGGTLASGREFEEGPGLVVWAASLPGRRDLDHARDRRARRRGLPAAGAARRTSPPGR